MSAARVITRGTVDIVATTVLAAVLAYLGLLAFACLSTSAALPSFSAVLASFALAFTALRVGWWRP